MNDYNQLLLRGSDYIKDAIANWNNRRDVLACLYVISPPEGDIRYRKRCIDLVVALEERIDYVLFELRLFQEQQEGIDKVLNESGIHTVRHF